MLTTDPSGRILYLDIAMAIATLEQRDLPGDSLIVQFLYRCHAAASEHLTELEPVGGEFLHREAK